MGIFFSSDNHFGHARVIEYCKRPFKDVHEMNREMILRWNDRVKPTDVVYHLGDFHMGPRVEIAGFRRRLNGRVILIRGNHDRSATAMSEAGFNEVYDTLRLDLGGVSLFLRHVPLGPDETSPQTDYALHGHVHEKWAEKRHPGLPFMLNVGVDVREFKPVSIDDLI